MPPFRVLIIDDIADAREGLRRSFRLLRPHWQVTIAASAEQAFDAMEHCFDAVIADVDLGGTRGTEVLRILTVRYPQALRVVLSGMIDNQTLVESAKWSDLQFCKPCPAEKVIADIESVLKERGRMRGLNPSQHHRGPSA